MAERASPRTLLEKIIRDGDHTIEEWCRRFDEKARSMKENTSLSPRQLQRWMAGQVDNARPAARRVAARLWDVSFPQLLGPASGGAVAKPSAFGGAVDTVAAERADSDVLEAVTTMAAHESSRHAAGVGGGVSQASIEQV